MREKRCVVRAVRGSHDRLKKRILLLALGRRRRRGVDFMSHWLGSMNNASSAFCPTHCRESIWWAGVCGDWCAPPSMSPPVQRDELSIGWLCLFLSNTHSWLWLPIRSSRFWRADFACFLAWPHRPSQYAEAWKLNYIRIFEDEKLWRMRVSFFSKCPKVRAECEQCFLSVQRERIGEDHGRPALVWQLESRTQTCSMQPDRVDAEQVA
jgi:hypothetical protein